MYSDTESERTGDSLVCVYIYVRLGVFDPVGCNYFCICIMYYLFLRGIRESRIIFKRSMSSL